MKKIISWGIMLAAAFTLTNCAKEIENPNEQPETAGYPFEIVASTAVTKTVNDGMHTKWAAKDTLNVFHTEAGTKAYGTNDSFVVSDTEEGSFKGNLTEALEDGKSYDWYALYPYSNKITTPAATESGFTYIGHSKGLNQTDYNNMASLKGNVCPLYGVAKSVPASEMPSITMNHLSSVVAINVTNMNEEPLTITEASFTATEDIVGSYYIDITGESVVYTPSAANYVKNTALVRVSGGTALSQGESAVLYAAIKPFTAAAGQKLTLSVNGYSKEIELLKDVTFTAGKIKTLNFAYNKAETPVEPAPEGVKTATISFSSTAQRTSYSSGQQVWENEDVIFTNSKGSSTSNVGNYSNPARFYKSSNISVTAPGNITMLEFDCSGLESKYVTPFTDLGGVSDNGIVKISLDGTSSTVSYTSLSAQARAYRLTVTYIEGEGGEAPEAKVLESIEVPEATISYNVGDNFIKPVVIATYSDATTADVTESATFSGYDMATAGIQTVTVSYTENEITKTTEYEITVNEIEVEETITTTIEEFLAITEENANIYILTGKIVSIEEISSQYKNATLTIADDNGNELYIYRMKSAEGGDAIEALGLTLGDILTVSGKWGTHGGAVQLVSGVYVNHEDHEAPEQEGTKEVTVKEFLEASVSTVTKYRLTGEIVMLEAFNTQYNNVSLTLADETGEVYVYRMTAPEGSAIDQLGLTIGDILTVEGNRSEYNSNPQLTNSVYVSHEDVNVEEPEVPSGTTEVELVLADCGYANAESLDGRGIALDENVTVIFAQGKAGTAPAYYTSGSAVRLYQNGATMDIITNGKTITKIELTFSQSHYYIAPDCGTLSDEASVRTWTGDATAVKFTTTGTDKNHRAYIAKIKVSYTE